MKIISRHNETEKLRAENAKLKAELKLADARIDFFRMENDRLNAELNGRDVAGRDIPGASADLRRENLRLRCRNSWLEGELEKSKRSNDWLIEAHLRTIANYLDLEKELPPNE